MSNSSDKKLSKLIDEDKLEEVIALLQQEKELLNDRQNETILSLSTSLRQLRQQQTRGIITPEKAQIEQEKLKKQLQILVFPMEKSLLKRTKAIIWKIVKRLFSILKILNNMERC